MSFQMRSFIRKGSAWVLGPEARIRYCMLSSAQPLLLHPEPNNRKDASAVKVTDLNGGPCGYVAREDAVLVAARIRAGEMLLCRTDGGCGCIMREIVIWSDGNTHEEERKTSKPKARGRTLVGAHDGGDDDPMRNDWHDA